MTPIDRGDKHWCDPASETPDGDGRWTCPCGQGWRLDWDGVWRPKGSALPERVDPAATDGTGVAQQNQQEVGDYPPDEMLPTTETEEQG